MKGGILIYLRLYWIYFSFETDAVDNASYPNCSFNIWLPGAYGRRVNFTACFKKVTP